MGGSDHAAMKKEEEEEEERTMKQEQLKLTPPGYPRMESPPDKNNKNRIHRQRGGSGQDIEDHCWCVTAILSVWYFITCEGCCNGKK